MLPGSSSTKSTHLKEKLRITTSKRNFKSVDLNNVRKMKEQVKESEVSVEGMADSSRSPWVMLTVLEKLKYQKAMRYFRFAPFLAMKFIIFLQASITVFFIIGLSATVLRLLQEIPRDGRLTLDIFDHFGFWSGFVGVFYFIKLVLFQWSFGAV